MNGSIIRYLALNGPSLIYSVSKHLSEKSETKIHYPTVNRRMHDLLNQKYLEKAGTRNTKAGTPADLYATTLRGDFVAIAGTFYENQGRLSPELSPKETLQLIRNAANRSGSPFVLLRLIHEDSQTGQELLSRVLLPEIISGVRNGYLNLEASDNGVICSVFASLVARTVIQTFSQVRKPSAEERNQTEPKLYIRVLLSGLEKTVISAQTTARNQESELPAFGVKEDSDSNPADRRMLQLPPIQIQWAKELKVFLRLNSIKFG